MWDTFLNGPCQSCVVLTASNSFCKKKTDLQSVEYNNYIRKDILNKYSMKLPEELKSTSKTKQSQDSKRKKPSTAPLLSRNRSEESKSRKTVKVCKCTKEPPGKCDVTTRNETSKNFLETVIEEKRSIDDKSVDSIIELKKKKLKNSSVAFAILDSSNSDSKFPRRSLDKSKELKINVAPDTAMCSKTYTYLTPTEPTVESQKTLPTCMLRFVGSTTSAASESKLVKISRVSVSKRSASILKTPKVVTPQKRCSYFMIHKFGERGSGTRTRSGEVQDFYRIRDECLANGTLFEDPEFPATDSSLFFSQRPDRHYEWRRPNEIVENPQFFVEGYSRFDVQQGELGDCWLLAAAANLTLYRRLFFQIVPDDQDFEDKYAGVFHFRFWQYGKWVDVVIDDRLPTYRGELIFLHSTEVNEFWSALLEKAYAKLHGSYEALKGGSTCEAMEDFTGGVTEMYEMEACPPNLFQIIMKAYERSSLMGCSIEPDPNIVEAQTPEGLIRGHAYSITRVNYVDIQTPNVTGKIPLLRLRNPWGNESEWNGAWSDGAPEWRFISESEKEELGLTFDNDGEFWMSYKDFQKHFSRLEICNLNPDSLSEEELLEGHKKKWEISVFEGEWVRGVTAGGCRNFLESFWHNPQYRITLTEVDEGEGENECTIIVALMQKNRRHLRSSGGDLLTIGFAIYHLSHPDRLPKPLDLNFFKYNASVARSPSFINLREVSCRFKLPPGTYCIVPTTFDPNEEGEFLLRVFTEKQNVMEENDEDVGYGEIDEKVTHEATPQEKEETDKVYESFLKLAGEDQEVDWMELKEILDYAMKGELHQGKSNGLDYKKTQKLVDAAPQQQVEQTSSQGNNILMSLLAQLCGTLCKDNPLAEVIPAPTQCTTSNTALTELMCGDGFSKDICRSMVAMLDMDRSGKLGYKEFQELWLSLRNWKNAWLLYDTDHSGTFSGFELRDALSSVGYKLNSKVLNILMHRYGNKSGQIHFDDFMMCAIKLKKMLDVFNEKNNPETNTAKFTMEEWLETTLYT